MCSFFFDWLLSDSHQMVFFYFFRSDQCNKIKRKSTTTIHWHEMINMCVFFILFLRSPLSITIWQCVCYGVFIHMLIAFICERNQFHNYFVRIFESTMTHLWVIRFNVFENERVSMNAFYTVTINDLLMAFISFS